MVNEGEPSDEKGENASSDAAAAHRRAARERDEDDDKLRSSPLGAAFGRSALRLAGRLSFRSIERVGGAAGAWLARLPTRERSATRINLALCLPELDAAARARLERESLRETGRTMFELGALWTWPGERALALIREVRGRELLDAALAQGRGVVLLAPHLGAWELVGLYMSSIGAVTSLYKPPRIREMEEFYLRARQRLGARLVPADAGGVRALQRALKSGELIGILPDQDPGRGSGIFVPFFGALANTSTLGVKLAQRYDAPAMLAWAERLPDAAGFRVHIRPLADEEFRSPDLALATAAMNRELERLIRAAPAQYLWSYKRFRYRPPGLLNPYRHGLNERTLGARR